MASSSALCSGCGPAGTRQPCAANGVNLSRTAIIVAAVTAAITLILAGVAGADMYKMQRDKPTSSDPSKDSVGSCWSHQGADKVFHVACKSSDATLIVTSKVTDPAQCPTGYLTRTGYYLCLSPH